MSWLNDPRINEGSRNQSGPLFDIGFRGPGRPRAVKGRHVTHEEPFDSETGKPGSAPLVSKEDVKVIREWWREGYSVAEISRIIDYSKTTIHAIVGEHGAYQKEL